VRLLRGATPQPGSIWFGRRIDGVLFPVLALLLACGALGLQAWPAGGAVQAGGAGAVSLVVIRLTVRVLHRAFPTFQRHACGRAQRVVAGLDRRGAVDHRACCR
jgi:hypothetical protein